MFGSELWTLWLYITMCALVAKVLGACALYPGSCRMYGA